MISGLSSFSSPCRQLATTLLIQQLRSHRSLLSTCSDRCFGGPAGVGRLNFWSSCRSFSSSSSSSFPSSRSSTSSLASGSLNSRRRLSSGCFEGKGIVVLAGPSGVGKSSLIQRLQSRHPGLFGFSVSATTREPRAGEEHGVHYLFSSKDAILRRIADGHFVEHAEVHGNLYGTSVDAVSSVVESGKVCLLDIDCQGVVQVQDSSLHCDTTYIFVKPPALPVLESRLRKRGTETEESIAKRLRNAVSECSFAEENGDRFDLLLVNDDLDTAYRNFEAHLEEACQLAARREQLDL